MKHQKARGKALWLVQNHGGEFFNYAPPFDLTGKTVNICVIDNGPFEAAGIAFSQKEQILFAAEDGRPKLWVRLPRFKVIELCPHVEDLLIEED